MITTAGAVNSSTAQRRIARALGSTDWHLRDSGLKQVLVQLIRLSSLPDGEARQLWKGLFYAFWHSDKAPVQVGHSSNISVGSLQHRLTVSVCRRRSLRPWQAQCISCSRRQG